MSVVHGRSMRVFINDVDVSGHVRKLKVRAAADRITEVRLRLFASPVIDADGHVRLTLPGAVASGHVASPEGPLRGITVRAREGE